MNTDLNGKIQGKLNQNRKNRNTKKALLVLSLAAVIFTSTVLANPASALAEDVSDEVVQGLESGGNSGSGAQDPVEAADEQTNAQGNEAAPSSDPQETPAAPSADQGVMNANSVSAVDSAAVTENGTGDGGIAVSGAEADGTEKSADQISAAEGSGTAEQGATLAEAAETVSTEEAAAEKTTEKTEQAAQSETDVLSFADDRAQVKIARKDGAGFPSDTTMSGSPLGTDDWNRVLSAVSSKVKAQSDDSTAYSVAGLHTWKLSLQAGDGSAASYDDIRAEAEFQGGLNDAGYAAKTSEKEENGTDGTSITTASYETSWRVYAISGDSIADPVEDHLTDLTDADGTSLSVDENGALQSAAFDGSLPETVVFAQIVRETVTTGTEKKKEIPMPAVTFDKEAATDHGTIMVHVEADEGTFEQGTTMSVKQVSSQDILDKAIEAAGGRGSAAAVDISFRKADGTETEPAKPIRVKMTAKVLSQADKVHVVHVDDTGSTVVVARKSDGKTIESTSSEAASSDAKNAVSFESDSFSVYAIVYTVDFEYSVNGKMYQFSLPGGEKIALSDLIEVLGIIGDTNNGEKAAFNSVDSFLKEVANVEFSDESLVKVTQNEEGNDWTLESLEPFNTEETLTISMKNGDVVVVKVTDLQYTTSLNDVLTDLTINGADWDAATGSYTVKPGKSYTVNMTFQESETGYQFSNDGWMTLNLPSGVTFETGGTFNITVNEAGENFTISGNQIEALSNGTIRIKFNENVPNYKKLKDITTAKFTVSVTGKFSRQSSEYVIDGKTDTKVKVDNTPDVNVTKSGSVVDWNSSSSTATVKYRLEVRSNGEASGIEIEDYISGTGLTYNRGTISITQNNQPVSGWTTNSESDLGFKLTTDTLEDGKTYVVEYTASLDKSQLVGDGNGNYDVDANNKVDWTGDKTTTHDLGHVVTKPGMSKRATGSSQSGSVTTTTWTIEADSDYSASGDPTNQLKTITDRLASEGMHYAGQGLHVVITDRDTNQQVSGSPVDISWNILGVTNISTSWAYDFSSLVGGNDGKKYHYTITYDTTYDIGDATEAVNIKNDWKDNRGNEGESQTQVQPNPENRYNLWKEYTSKEITTEGTIVTWTIHVTVPAAGVPADKAVLTETLPSTGGYQDTYAGHDTKWVTGLLDGESVKETNNNDGTVLFTFTKDGTNPGLKAHGDPSNPDTYKARDITLTIKTKCDAGWLNDETVNQTHDNKVNFADREGHAYFTPDKPSSRKNGWRDGEEGGLPKFTYDVVVGVISDDLFSGNTTYTGTTVGTDTKGKYIEITDTFDSRLAYVTGSAKVYGGDQNSQQNGETALGNSAVYDADNHKITFKLYQNDLPKYNGNLYQYYRVHYSLKVNSQTDLESMRNEAISSGKAIELDNSVTGFGGSETKVNYEPKVLDKFHQTVDGKLEFTIKVNEEGLKLSDDGVLVLTDDMTNLSVRYQDVTVSVAGDKTVETTDADGNPVTAPYFNMKGNRLTFYLPDEAAVTITYRATPRGEVGSDGKIHYSNTAKLLGFKKTDGGEKDYQSEASGYGTNYAVYIYKADGNVNSNALGGAEFKLYEADEVDADGNIISGTPVKMKDGSDYTVTTSDGKDGSQKGLVRVMGTEDLGWNLKPEKRYYLLETKAPEGYALDPTKYSFIISKDGYVNYTSSQVVAPDGSGKLVQAWTYHNGDVITVKNYRKDGVLTLEKGFAGNIDPDKMTDDQKAAIKFEIYTISGEGSETTETLWRTITYDRFTAGKDGKYTYTIGDLPEGKYKVKEIVDDATCMTTTYQVTDTDADAEANNTSENKDERYATVVISAEDVSNHTENKVDVTNTYEIPSELNIFKHAEGETSYKVAGAKFGVYAVEDNTWNRTGDALATYTTNARGRFSILKDAAGSYTFEFDKVYALVETEAPAGFLPNETPVYFYFQSEGNSSTPTAPDGKQVVVIPFKETKEQNISDTPDTTSLEATKVYLNDLLEPEDPDGVTSVNVRIKQIASYDKAGKVVEDELSGYYKAGQTTPVKTAAQATPYQIVKENGTWHLSGNGVENGKLKGLPTMTFDNHIPIYYHYEVEEVNPGDYIPSYKYVTNEDGSTTATVTNKPNTNNPTTRVTARKRWVDVNGDDVTSKMGLDDGVTVDVYRYPGELTRGTIYESDRTVRDAGQQYTITLVDGENGSGNTSLLCLPGDRIRYRIKALGFQNNNTISTAQVSVRCNQDVALGTVTKTIDTANNEIIFEFDAPTDSGNRNIWMEIQQIYPYVLSSENISAVGRTQVVTQADIEGLENVTKVETLELNKMNGWSAISREYVKRGMATIQHEGWSVQKEVTYTYFIKEPDGANYQAEYHFEGNTITAVNVDKKLEVDKKWLAANGDDITSNIEDGTITYTIKRDKYIVTPPETARIDYSGLKAAGTSVSAESIAQNIKVGATIKVTVKIKDRTPNAEDSPLDGMVIEGGRLISYTDAYRVNTYNPNQYDWMRDYFVEVTDTTVKLSGDLKTKPDYGSQTKLSVSIQKEPAAILTPAEGQQPDGDAVEVGTVTVAYDHVVSHEFVEDYADATVTQGELPWSVMISKLPAVDQNGNIYTYTVQETAAENFEQVEIDDEGNVSATLAGLPYSAPLGGNVTFVNRLKKGELKVKKAVTGAAPADKTYEIAVRDAEGNYFGTDGSNYGQVPHYETFRANDEKIWTPLTPGKFTVSEKDASVAGYTWTVSGTGDITVVQGETAKTTVTNSYFKDTEYTPKVTKSLKEGDDEVSSWPKGASFDFYLTFIEGYQGSGTDKVALTRNDIVMNGREAQATEDDKTASFDKIDFKKPGTYIFEIEEVEPAGTQNHKKNGIVYSTEKVTLTIVVGEKENAAGELEVTSATYSSDNGIESEADKVGLITNTMDYPTYAPSVTKSLKNGDEEASESDWNGKSFTFDLANTTTGTDAQNVIMPSSTEKTVTSSSSGHKETFDAITFKAAGTYTFTVTERQGTETNIQYDTTAKKISVKVEPDDDGNLSVTKVTIGGTEVTGESIIASGVTIENTIVKPKDFDFTKEWHDSSDNTVDSWPENTPIKVKVYKYLASNTSKKEEIGTYEITKTDSEFTISKSPDTAPVLINEENSFAFKLSNLDGYGTVDGESGILDYYAVEYEKVSGYKDPTYANKGENGTTYTPGGDNALNHGKIINRPEDSYELPSTGGPGTRLYTILGMMLIALSGTAYMILLRRRRASLKGGDNPR